MRKEIEIADRMGNRMNLLRRTVARAFSAPAGASHPAVEPGAPRDHSQALGRFFRSLARAFEVRSERFEAGGCESARQGRAGIEFTVETPGGEVLFRNRLHGMVSVLRSDAQAGAEMVELLGVQRLGDEYVPIRKPISVDPGNEGASGCAAGFSYTSVNELVEEYMEAN